MSYKGNTSNYFGIYFLTWFLKLQEMFKLRRCSSFDRIITSLAKEKLREGRSVCKGVFRNTFKARVTTVWLMTLKLFLLIKLTHRILPEEKNSGERSLRHQDLIVQMSWKNDFFYRLSHSFSFGLFKWLFLLGTEKQRWCM